MRSDGGGSRTSATVAVRELRHPGTRSEQVALISADEAAASRQERLLTHTGSAANEIVDTYLAALAIEHSATPVSSDRGFSRFPDLAWIDPADPAGMAMLTG